MENRGIIEVVKVIASYPAKRQLPIQVVYWLLAITILLVTLYELFKFEDIAPALYATTNTQFILEPLIALAVSAQVFALPFLLGMKISPLMRIFSIGCSAVAIVTMAAAIYFFL